MLSDQIKIHTGSRNGSFKNAFQKSRDRLRTMSMKKIIPLLFIVIAIIGVGIAALNLVLPKNDSLADNRIDLKGPKSTQELKKEFSFPIMGANGKEVTKLKLFVDRAEIRDEVIVQGQKAYPVKGKTFFIADMRFRNDFDQPIEIKARDYIRLEVNGNKSDKLAADIHNDPVTIQPLSTKQVRLGFFINDTDEKAILFVGELKGKKTEIPVNF